MAALMRHASLKSREELRLPARISILIFSFRTKTTTNRIKPNPFPKTHLAQRIIPNVDSARESLAARGFLRPQKEYKPPGDVTKKVQAIFKTVSGTETESHVAIKDPALRFALLNACFEEFHHDVPNSLLHTMETLADVIGYYETEVNVSMPLDALKTMDLPANLHIQHEYHRFHPETDTMFGGVSAFTKSSTLVTGLKYKGKYRGHVAKTSWP